VGEVAGVSKKLVLSSSKSEAIFVDCVIPADEGTTFLRNLGNHSQNDTASYHRRPESSATPLEKVSNPLKLLDSFNAHFHIIFKCKETRRVCRWGQ